MTFDPTSVVTSSIDDTQTLNEIVARYPAALPVLQGFGLDTCCGGALSLRTAAAHHELDAEQVLRMLRAVIEGDER